MIRDVVRMKKDGGIEYQNLTVMGEAVLKPIVLEYIYAKGGRNELTNDARVVLENGEGNAMPRFFDKYIMEEHKKQILNEADISSNGKANMVEALLEVARRDDDIKQGGRVFKFIMSTLLKSYNDPASPSLTRVVGKKRTSIEHDIFEF
jgi:hypothetical protein